MTRRRMQSWASTLLLIVSLTLFAIVAVLYFRGDDNPSDPLPPTPLPGQNKAIDVLNALAAQDLDPKFGAQGSDVRADILERPGQAILLDEGTVYVFIYQDQSTQEDVLRDLTVDMIEVEDVAGDPVDIGQPQLFANSNVAVLLVNGTEDEAEKVSDAIASLQ
jgi:hypothetical protein